MDGLDFEKFKKGDAQIFEKVFHQYYGKIVGFVQQFIPDEDQAKSIAQETFVTLWTNRRDIRAFENIQSFLFKTSKNNCLNVLRHRKVQQKYNSFYLNEWEHRLNLEVLNSFKFDSMTFSQLEQILEREIAKLPERCREVFLKKRFEHKRNKEIAEEMGITTKAVEANMTRALKVLRVSLADYFSLLLF